MVQDLSQGQHPDEGDSSSATPEKGRRRFVGGSTVLKSLWGNPKALVGVILLLLFGALALLAPVIAPGDPQAFVDRPRLEPSLNHLLGTTASGQDVFAQTVWGARVSLTTGLLVGLATTAVGIVVGMSAGYMRGRIDDGLSLVTNVFLIMPTLPLLITLAAFLPTGFTTIVIVLSITGWAWPARVLRSQTLSLREKDFVAAAEVVGESKPRIILREIVPNMLSVIAASFIGSVTYGIGAQAGLEFIGLGDPGVVSWGTNLYWAQNSSSLLTGAWWTFVPAGVCIALVAFGLALMNYAIDEVTNPRLRSQRETNVALKKTQQKLGSSRATPVLRHLGAVTPGPGSQRPSQATGD
jgi:peptide/nickel transport system permease protein